MTGVFTAEQLPPVDIATNEIPVGWWAAGVGGAVGVSLVAIATFVASFRRVDSPVLLAILLALAVSPMIVQLRFDVPLPVVAIWTLVPLAMLNLFGSPLGLYDSEGRTQTTMMMFVWFVGQTAAVGSRRVIAAVTAAALAITIGRYFTDPVYGAEVIWSAGVITALLAGLVIRALLVAVLNGKIAQEALSEQATTAERQRIAREVHDVIAHSLTVTMLHLTAARLAVGRGDNTAATEALEEAEKAGRTSLNEIRHTVGLLRTDGTGPSTDPLPSAPDVPALVDGYRAAGLDVSLDLHGDLDRVEPAAGLALYRIVQESLTNAGRHAPGARTTVHIEVGPPLNIDVRTEGAAPNRPRRAGMGLTGMAERAAALGGSFEAGQSDTEWRVAATLP
jgi:signal transduction histidine kinase